MRQFLFSAALSVLALTFAACAQEAAAPPANGAKLDTLQQKGSYGIGLSIGTQLGEDAVDIDMDALLEGLRDGLSKKEPRIPRKDLQQIMAAFQQEVEAKAELKRKESAAKNLKDGQDFLAENAKRKGVTTLPSGLQYEVLADGKGAVPKASDTVKTHYKGTLINGEVFDSSYDRGEPAEFEVGGVIKGWVEALQLMKTGSKWKLFVPSNLAYGERGAGGGKIGPNAVLVFEVELLGVNAAPTQPKLPLNP